MLKAIQIRYDGEIYQNLEYASLAGFKEVSIGFGDNVDFFNSDYEPELEKLAMCLSDNKLRCVQTHLPCYHLHVPQEEIHENFENAIKNALIASSFLGAKWSAFHPRSDVSGGYDRTSAYRKNYEMLSGYLETSEKCGCGIAVENMPLYPSSYPEWRFFGGGYEEIIELCDELGSEKAGICWDFGHAHTAGIDQKYALRKIGKRLKITHVHDNYKNGDHHVLPLTGDEMWGCIKWDEIMPVMKDTNYEGPLTLELIFPPMGMRKSFMMQCFDCTSELCRLSDM